MASDKTYRIIIADPSEIITQGLSILLSKNPNFKVVECFNSAEKLIERLPIQKIDVLIINPTIIDYSMRTMVRDIFPIGQNVALIALVGSFIEGRVLKEFSGIIEINDSQIHIESTIVELAQMAKLGDANEAINYNLSKREVDVLIAVAKGLQNKEIADCLNISIHTVISHRKNISHKTGIKSVSGLTVYALLNKLIDERDVH